MWKYTVRVTGMMCGMCESHVNDAVRRAFPVKKVTSSRSKKETTVIAETELDEAALREAIRATGYDAGEIRKKSPGEEGAVRPVSGRGHRSAERGRQTDAGRGSGGPWRLLVAVDARSARDSLEALCALLGASLWTQSRYGDGWPAGTAVP